MAAEPITPSLTRAMLAVRDNSERNRYEAHPSKKAHVA
jgi:hypothetical protein